MVHDHSNESHARAEASRRDHHAGHGHHHHEHEHGHAHGHGHGRGGGGHGTDSHNKGHSHDDAWSGDEYLNYPGLRQLAKFSQTTVVHALQQAGLKEERIKALNVLEVGCGAGAVTQLYAESFASVHAIDVSVSMLATFSSELPSDRYPNVTYSQHTLSPQSGQQFASDEPVLSPTKADPERRVKLPRKQFDVAVINLVLHHVDDIEGFMKGLKDVVVPGGMVIFTEFTNLHMHRKETEQGSVNAPDHFHHEFNENSISALLGHCCFGDIHTEIRGKMAIWRDGKFHDVDCLLARGRKPSTSD